ncbi:MAG: precorrin-6A reductase [Eubacteriales bacterium]
MKKKPVFWIIAGTSEGRELVEKIAATEAEIFVFLATEYGKTLIYPKPNVHISAKRLDREEMESFINSVHPDCVIDATHPYAREVTENIYTACLKTKVRYLRVLRPKIEFDLSNEAVNDDQVDRENSEIVFVDSTKEAADFLNHTTGKILLASGSKEIHFFTGISDFENRIYARVLPMEGVIEKCTSLGIKSSQLICMQGPFSKELNLEILKAIEAKYIVTKESGTRGGFKEKILAAQELGVKAVVIRRRSESKGLSLEEIEETLIRDYELKWNNELELDKNVEKKIPNVLDDSYNTYFPLFISMTNKKVIIFGAGNIALRRIETLLCFDADIEVFAPEINREIAVLFENCRIKVNKRFYESGDCAGADLVVAATNDRMVNRAVAEECSKQNIPVSVADDKELCTFLFPAVIKEGDLVIGLTSGGKDHRKVKNTAENIRTRLHELLE